MLIPLRTDRLVRRPVATDALILANALAYLAMLAGERFGLASREAFVGWGQLVSGPGFRLHALVTYAFLHDPRGLLHLLFNMLFLRVFGGAVEERLGRPGYLALYLGGAVAAGLAHMAAVPGVPVIGASGAVCAVTGAFLALFPRSRVVVVFFLIIIGVRAIPAPWLIGLFFALDLLNQLGAWAGAGGGTTAYAAHLAGYAFGFGVPFALLGLRILPRTEYDAFFALRQARRRRAFRAMTRRADGVWEPGAARLAEPARADAALQAAEDRRRRLASCGETVRRLAAAGDLVAAAAALAALGDDAAAVALPPGLRLDLAGLAHAAGRHAEAVRLAEPALAHAAGEVGDDLRLLAGACLGMHLHRPAEARPLLEAVQQRGCSADRRRLAAELLDELRRLPEARP